MKTSRSYKEGIAALEVNGIPDNSLGHSSDTIGILLSWKLTLIGLTVLEGKKEHLLNLAYVILSYSRSCISGLPDSISDKANSIKISAVDGGGHELKLVSMKKDVEPLTIILDDAELSDLTRCLDKILVDSCIAINWLVPLSNPFACSKFYRNPFYFKEIINSIVGLSCLCITAFVFLNLPLLQPSPTLGEDTIEKDTYTKDINK